MNKVLIGFSEGDVSIWSLYEKKLVMTGSAELQVNGAKLNDVQWLDNQGELFVSGYDDGSIWLWNVPHAALAKFGPPSKPVNATPFCRVEYSSGTGVIPFTSIVSLKCGQSSVEMSNELDIFAHGITQDGMKALVTIGVDKGIVDKKSSNSSSSTSSQPEGYKVKACKSLPWFGDVLSFCTIESISSNLELEISAVVSLAEFSTIHIYDIEQYMPFQIDTSFQRCTQVQCISVERSENKANSTMYERLIKNPEQVFHPSVLASGSPWPVVGGRETEIATTSDGPIEWGLMISGHQDGVARVWDTGYNSIKLLGSFPRSNAPTASISCLSVSSNLIVLGYEIGEVRAYLSASEEKFAYEKLVIGESLQIENVTHDGTPFACLISSNTHQHEISALHCCIDRSLIACGDTSGTVSVIDLEGNTLFCGEIFPSLPVASVLLVNKECINDEVHRCLVLSSKECSLCLLDLDDTSAPFPEITTPKNTAEFLHASILNQCSQIVEANGSGAELVLPGLQRKVKRVGAGSTTGKTAAKSNMPKSSSLGDAGAVESDQELSDTCSSSSDDEFPDDMLANESEGMAGLSAIDNGTHILQCSSGYLRIYPLSGIARGERGTWKKHRCDVPLKLASAVNRVDRSNEASCVVTIDENTTLSIWSIPNFENYWSRHLADILGFDYALTEEVRVHFSCDGQVLLFNGTQEIVRVALPKDEKRNPLPSLCLHDKDVADATQAAIAALHASKTEEEVKTPKATAQSKFSSFLSSATSMMTGQSLPPPLASQPSVQQLHTVFEQAIMPLRKPTVAARQNRAPARQQFSSPPLNEEQHDRDRAELLKMSAKQQEKKRPARAPGRRTVDEIKAAYGRDNKSAARRASSKTGELKSVMAENMNKLAERGERLNQISDKTQQLENDAEDFMTMAKKLAEREKNKKWWEF